jgi:hypothetical protein
MQHSRRIAPVSGKIQAGCRKIAGQNFAGAEFIPLIFIRWKAP